MVWAQAKALYLSISHFAKLVGRRPSAGLNLLVTGKHHVRNECLSVDFVARDGDLQRRRQLLLLIAICAAFASLMARDLAAIHALGLRSDIEKRRLPVDVLRRVVHALIEHIWLDARVGRTQSQRLEQVLKLGAEVIRPVAEHRVVLASRPCLLCILNSGLAVGQVQIQVAEALRILEIPGVSRKSQLKTTGTHLRRASLASTSVEHLKSPLA